MRASAYKRLCGHVVHSPVSPGERAVQWAVPMCRWELNYRVVRYLCHDPLLRSYVYHVVSGVLTARNLTPEKRECQSPSG